MSPDPSNGTPPLVGVPPQYKSGLILHQQERNSPSYQSYKQKNHDYVNSEYILHTGSLASRGQNSATPVQMKGIVQKRSAAFEAFVQGTLQNGHGYQKSVPNLMSMNQSASPGPISSGHNSPFQLVNNANTAQSAFQHIKQKSTMPNTTPSVTAILNNTFENYIPKTSASPYQQLIATRQGNTLNKPPSPFQRNQYGDQQQPVKVILSNGSKTSSYKSTIESKVKILNQNPNQTYVSNMHVRVPSQESSIYSDTRTYINMAQPVAIASKGGILMNPSHTQLNSRVGGGNKTVSAVKAPAIPRSQVVKKVMEPSYSSLLQNQGEQNQAIYANFDFRSSDGSNTEEEVAYTSPPSPVSSSYSELRTAARGPLGAAFHQMNPQAMIYDPLYEPISGQNSISNQHKPNFGLGGLSSHYDDSFGPCSKCLQLIVGEGTGCSAMGRLYHIKCFTCHNCQCQLQGKPFYALDGKVSNGTKIFHRFNLIFLIFSSPFAKPITLTLWKSAASV